MKNITFLILFSYVQLAHSFIWHDGSGLAFYDSASDVCQLIVSGFPPEIQLVETEVQGSGASCKLERCGDDSCVDIDSKAVYSVSDQFAISLPNNNDTSSCSLAGNPINPSSGSKVQHEPLISLGSSFPLVFDLYYNSSSLDKWRHSYSRSILLTAQRNFPRYDFINGYPFGANPLADPESPGYLSGEAKSAVYGKKANMPMTAWYGTPDEACVVGWISYQSHVNYYWEDTSSASYSGNGLCEIFDTSENPPRLKMRIPVYSKYHGRSLGQFSDAGYLPPSTLRFSRQDGSVVIFEDEAGVWKNKSNTGERVETVYDVGAVNILGYRYYTAQDEIEEYDDNGRLTSISTDDGRIQKLNYFVHADTGKTLLGKVYNVSGNNEVTDELNFVYEVYGDEDQYNRVESITDNNRTWSFRYSTSNGNLEFIDNPDGTTRRYHYDNDDHPYKLTGITDENGERYASWDYDSSNKAILSAHGPDADIEKVTLSYLSGSSIVTKVKKSADGQTSKNIVSTHATQISGGAAVSASITGHDSINYEYDSLTGYIEAVQDKGLRTEYRSRDVKGNPEIIKEAVGTTEQRETSYTYDPRYHSKVETITEASVFPGNQKVTTNQYDDFGNNTAVTISGFTLSGTAVSRSITFQYNGPYHQLTQINGPRSDVSDIYTIDYYPDNATEGDNRARMKRVTAPLNITLYDNITYTPTGKIKTYTDANNVQTMLSYYFGNDRLQSLSQLDLNTADNRLTEWTYLATGEVETITTGQDLADKTTLTLIYDDARRLTGIIDGLGNTIEYILDSEGNVEQENIKDNSDNIKKQLSQTFDDYNRLQLRTQVNEQFTETWSPNGTLDKTVDGKNVTTDYSYDNLRRLTQINQDMGGTSPQTANALTILNYDVQDNLSYVKNPVNGETIYTYDDLGNQLSARQR